MLYCTDNIHHIGNIRNDSICACQLPVLTQDKADRHGRSAERYGIKFKKEVLIMELKLGDVQTTALIPLAVKANETLRKKARIKDQKAVEIIKTLKIDTAQAQSA